jgi:1-acyl-sn-glycerol-3-phosphate acyltransferase
LSYSGLEHLPKDQPYLLAANHSSHLDMGAVVVSLLGQVDQVSSLGAKDYFFDQSLKAWFFQTFLHLIPLEREGNFSEALAALRQCQQVLAPRRPVLVFPEGTRSQTGELQPFQPGVGLIATRLGIPIVPVYIEGAYQALPKGHLFPRKRPIRVTFGQPIFGQPIDASRHPSQPMMTDRGTCQAITDKVREAIIQLRSDRIGEREVIGSIG